MDFERERDKEKDRKRQDGRKETYSSGQGILEGETCCVSGEDLGVFVYKLCGEHEHVCGLEKDMATIGIENEMRRGLKREKASQVCTHVVLPRRRLEFVRRIFTRGLVYKQIIEADSASRAVPLRDGRSGAPGDRVLASSSPAFMAIVRFKRFY